jgi:hypothetical protein
MEQYDVELVLRFTVFSTIDVKELNNIGDVGVFLTKKMIDFARDKDFDYQDIENRFKATFDILYKSVGPNAFRKYSIEKKKYIGGFLLSPYEVIAYGLGFNFNNLPPVDKIEEIIHDLWINKTYTQWSGTGITATRRLPRLIPLGRELFSK